MAFDLSSLTSFLKADNSKALVKSGVLGIDIGSSAIKIVQLKDVKGVPTLETYGELQLGPYEGVDIGRGTHLPQQKMSEALVDIIREAGATSTTAAYAISYNASFTATISIPALDIESVRAMIPTEAKKYIPISLTRVSLDWFPLSVHEEEKTTTVLLSATYNEARSRYESIMKINGLNIMASEIEIFSAIRSVLSPKDETVAILDFGASATRVYIIRKGVIAKTHSVLLSGNELTQALVDALGIEFKEGEELKRTVGLVGRENDPRIQKALLGCLNRGLREIHTVVKRYEESEGVSINKIVMNGSAALLRGLGGYVQDMFSHPVETANPFAKVAYPAFLEDTLTQAGPTFAFAVGVALRAFQTTE